MWLLFCKNTSITSIINCIDEQAAIFSNKEDVSIDLFTSDIIAGAFIEESIELNTSAKFVLAIDYSITIFYVIIVHHLIVLNTDSHVQKKHLKLTQRYHCTKINS